MINRDVNVTIWTPDGCFTPVDRNRSFSISSPITSVTFLAGPLQETDWRIIGAHTCSGTTSEAVIEIPGASASNPTVSSITTTSSTVTSTIITTTTTATTTTTSTTSSTLTTTIATIVTSPPSSMSSIPSSLLTTITDQQHSIFHSTRSSTSMTTFSYSTTSYDTFERSQFSSTHTIFEPDTTMQSLETDQTDNGVKDLLLFVLPWLLLFCIGIIVLVGALIFFIRKRKDVPDSNSNSIVTGEGHYTGLLSIENDNQVSDSPYAKLPERHRIDLESAGHVIPFQEIQLLEKLGEGQFGMVHKAVWRNTLVACKILKVGDGIDAEQIEMQKAEFEQEASLHKSLPHDANVVQFLGVCLDVVNSGALGTAIVVEFAGGGSLLQRLCSQGSLQGKDLIEMAKGIASGMSHLHESKVIHRDLACRNILLSESIPKVTDFGLSRVVCGEYITHTTVLPLKWLAPESIREKKFTTKTDVWSFGVCLWECMNSGKEPYPELTSFAAAQAVGYNGLKPSSEADILQTDQINHIQHIMEQCFENEDPRPSFRSIVSSL